MDVMRDTEMFLYECFECDGEGEAVYQVGVRDYDNGGYLPLHAIAAHRTHLGDAHEIFIP